MLTKKQRVFILELLENELEFMTKDYIGDNRKEQIDFIQSTIVEIKIMDTVDNK